MATGSPFGSVEFGGRTVRIGQGNNAFVFPGVGLGALVAEAREVTRRDVRRRRRGPGRGRGRSRPRGGLALPADGRACARVTVKVAEAVVREARDRGVGRPLTDAEIPRRVAAFMWEPDYPELWPA